MNIDACYQLGYVIKKHGVRGEVSVFIDADFPEDYSGLESVFVEINQKLVPFFVESIQVKGNKAVVKFEDINNQIEAGDLKSKKLYLPLTTLPPLSQDQFYYHEIVGYQVEDSNSGPIGMVSDVVTTAMQDILVLDHSGVEVLVPINDEIISSVDHDKKRLFVSLPDGLLEVYTS